MKDYQIEAVRIKLVGLSAGAGAALGPLTRRS